MLFADDPISRNNSSLSRLQFKSHQRKPTSSRHLDMTPSVSPSVPEDENPEETKEQPADENSSIEATN